MSKYRFVINIREGKRDRAVLKLGGWVMLRPVRASISTPVLPVILTVQRMVTEAVLSLYAYRDRVILMMMMEVVLYRERPKKMSLLFTMDMHI